MIKIVFSKEAEDMLKYFKSQAEVSKEEKTLLKSIEQKLEILKYNEEYGDPIKKKLIPLYYQTRYNTTNLFRIKLAFFWRMLYTLTKKGEVEIIAFVLDIFDHDKYDKGFKYKRR